MALSHHLLALQYGLRLDASPEFIRGYVDGMRLDQRGQGVACGRGWIPRTKKCSRDKASQTSKEAKAKTVERAKERAKLKGEVKAAKGQKARTKNPSSQDPIRPQKVNAPEALKQSVTGQGGKKSEVKPSINPNSKKSKQKHQEYSTVDERGNDVKVSYKIRNIKNNYETSVVYSRNNMVIHREKLSFPNEKDSQSFGERIVNQVRENRQHLRPEQRFLDTVGSVRQEFREKLNK